MSLNTSFAFRRVVNAMKFERDGNGVTASIFSIASKTRARSEIVLATLRERISGCSSAVAATASLTMLSEWGLFLLGFSRRADPVDASQPTRNPASPHAFENVENVT